MVPGVTNLAEKPSSRIDEIKGISAEMAKLSTDSVSANEGFNLNLNNAAVKMMRSVDSRQLETGVSANSAYNEDNQENKRNAATQQLLNDISLSTSQALARIAQIDAEIDSHMVRLEEIEAEMAEIVADQQILEVDLESATARLDKIDEEIADTEENIASNTVEVNDLVLQAVEAEQEVDDSQENILDLQDQISDLQENMPQAEAAIRNPNLSPAEQAHAHKQIEALTRLEEELERAITRYVGAVKDRTEKQEQINTIEAEIALDNERLENLRLEQIDVRNEINEIEEQINTNAQRYDTLAQEQTTRLVAVRDLSTERADIVNDLGNSQDVNDQEIYQDLIVRQAEIAERIAALEKQIDAKNAITQAYKDNLDNPDASDLTILASLEGEHREAYEKTITNQYQQKWAQVEDSYLEAAGLNEQSSSVVERHYDDPSQGNELTLTGRSVEGSKNFEQPAERIVESKEMEGVNSSQFDQIASKLIAEKLASIKPSNSFNQAATGENTAVAEPAPEMTSTVALDSTGPTLG